MTKRLKILLIIFGVLILGIFMLSLFRPYGVTGAVDAERVYKIAIENNDISICDKVHLSGFADLTNDEIRVVCYKEYAAAHPDQNICPRINNDYGCVNASASASLNPSACLVIEDSLFRSLCVYNVAANKHDEMICNILSSPSDQEQCKSRWIPNNGHAL